MESRHAFSAAEDRRRSEDDKQEREPIRNARTVKATAHIRAIVGVAPDQRLQWRDWRMAKPPILKIGKQKCCAGSSPAPSSNGGIL